MCVTRNEKRKITNTAHTKNFVCWHRHFQDQYTDDNTKKTDSVQQLRAKKIKFKLVDRMKIHK